MCANEFERRFRKATTSTVSDAKRTEDAATDEVKDVILDLLSCELSAGKVERAQQILRKISLCEHVSINNNPGRVYLHDTDTGLAVLDFISHIQIPTKKIDD